MLRLDKRRGPRVPVAMPVFVYGVTQGQPFSEHAETTNVSPQGGLVEISAEIEGRQPILVTNLKTNEELACRIARLAKTASGKTLIGLEFLRPSPNFWSVDFSPNSSQ
jgi:hypothetical protein